MTDEPLAPLPDRGSDPIVRMTVTLPTSLRTAITALGEADRRNPQNMALVLLYEAVDARDTKASLQPGRSRTPKGRAVTVPLTDGVPAPPPFQGLRPPRTADPSTATDTST